MKHIPIRTPTRKGTLIFVCQNGHPEHLATMTRSINRVQRMLPNRTPDLGLPPDVKNRTIRSWVVANAFSR